MIHDRYDEESGYRPSPKDFDPKHSKEYMEQIKREREEQPVITYKLSKEELERYLKKDLSGLQSIKVKEIKTKTIISERI